MKSGKKVASIKKWYDFFFIDFTTCWHRSRLHINNSLCLLCEHYHNCSHSSRSQLQAPENYRGFRLCPQYSQNLKQTTYRQTFPFLMLFYRHNPHSTVHRCIDQCACTKSNINFVSYCRPLLLSRTGEMLFTKVDEGDSCGCVTLSYKGLITPVVRVC